MELDWIYDQHVESLVRALALRDIETEAHTRRVAFTVQVLARHWEIPANETAHVCRGALLHDIGKIGIPDCILHKKTPLTEEEHNVISLHPLIAYKLLSSVPYLRPALDIPLYHHEKWDGTGYPRGLKREQIPFTARLFAVVDTWDALLSDRPYRPAWSVEQTRNYILAQSGRSFEPEIVTIFFTVMDTKNEISCYPTETETPHQPYSTHSEQFFSNS